MPPLKLVIPGRYWDSQIYRGKLHLFGMDGDILTLDWDRLIEDLRVRDELRIAVRSAFQHSDFLYGVAATGIFHDAEIREIISHRFHDLSQAPLELSRPRTRSVRRPTVRYGWQSTNPGTNRVPSGDSVSYLSPVRAKQ